MNVAVRRSRMLIPALAGLMILSAAAPANAKQSSSLSKGEAGAKRDGQHDFDWEIGDWATHVRVLRNPMSGATPDWAEYRGTSTVKSLLGGRANSVELSVSNDQGSIEGISLRLYNPQFQQWSLNYGNVRGGVMTAPVYGGFDGKGRGRFFGHDMLDGRAILVRFMITVVSPNEACFDQAFSADGGVSWETNWIAVDTRLAK